MFQGARLKRRTVAEVAAGGSLLACEMVVLGRAASGERFTAGLLLDAWSVRRAGQLAWTDTLRVEGETPDRRGLWCRQCAGHRDRRLGRAAAAVRAGAGAARERRRGAGGVTLVNGVMVARLLGEATAVRAAAIRFLSDFRGRRLPRVWHV